VDDVGFEVYRGDVFGFLGPNGAGKSTTLRMLLDLVKPDTGSIRYFGNDLKSHRNSILARIGCIVEKPDFYKYLSGIKNLNLLARISGIAIPKNRVEELLEFVGLSGRGHDAVKTYSHGMKQRLGIAQALLHDPELIILDEPTTGLDPQGIVDIRKLIKHLSEDLNKTIILSSHILSEAELTVNRMVILNKGIVAAHGLLKELLHEENAYVFFNVNEPEAAKDIVANSQFHSSLKQQNADGLEFRAHLKDIPAINKLLVEHGINVNGIESRRQLEEYFFRLTESAERMKIEI
jgi:ABC-2 type transport system ATP-binding protein